MPGIGVCSLEKSRDDDGLRDDDDRLVGVRGVLTREGPAAGGRSAWPRYGRIRSSEQRITTTLLDAVSFCLGRGKVHLISRDSDRDSVPGQLGHGRVTAADAGTTST